MTEVNYIKLPKGGIVFDAPKVGGIQIGSPPETIKDSLALDREVPTIFIAPKNLFSRKKMVSLFEMEFPCEYNFFVKRKKTLIICKEEQKDVIESILSEAIIGPSELNLERDFEGGVEHPHFPDLKKRDGFF